MIIATSYRAWNEPEVQKSQTDFILSLNFKERKCGIHIWKEKNGYKLGENVENIPIFIKSLFKDYSFSIYTPNIKNVEKYIYRNIYNTQKNFIYFIISNKLALDELYKVYHDLKQDQFIYGIRPDLVIKNVKIEFDVTKINYPKNTYIAKAWCHEMQNQAGDSLFITTPYVIESLYNLHKEHNETFINLCKISFNNEEIFCNILKILDINYVEIGDNIEAFIKR